MKKRTDESYPKREAKQRLDAALRGSRAVGPKPMKDIQPKQDEDPMPTDDPQKLIEWAKRNIEK